MRDVIEYLKKIKKEGMVDLNDLFVSLFPKLCQIFYKVLEIQKETEDFIKRNKNSRVYYLISEIDPKWDKEYIPSLFLRYYLEGTSCRLRLLDNSLKFILNAPLPTEFGVKVKEKVIPWFDFYKKEEINNPVYKEKQIYSVNQVYKEEPLTFESLKNQIYSLRKFNIYYNETTLKNSMLG